MTAGLRELVTRAIAERRCEAILLSGGLDTSIAATVARDHGLRLAVTVAVGDDPPDLAYATSLARALGIEHVVLRRSLDDLVARLPELIRLIGTFDGMFLRNDVVVYEGLREVAARGATACWTGDAADELFAGYSFMYERSASEIEATVRTFAAAMRFNGPRIGRALGVEVHSPYLHPEVIAHAVALPGTAMVMQRDGRRMGKAPLRRAFEGLVPDDHLYRRKDPIEVGSGATRLREHIAARVSDTFAAEAARILEQDRVRLRDAEHLAYYQLYREVFGGPPRPDPSLPKECPGCHARGPEGTYCTVCGAYPI
jgi:asparagine synthase (glutamine-hydrolysing)